jgi:hypothetical protein
VRFDTPKDREYFKQHVVMIIALDLSGGRRRSVRVVSPVRLTKTKERVSLARSNPAIVASASFGHHGKSYRRDRLAEEFSTVFHCETLQTATSILMRSIFQMVRPRLIRLRGFQIA